MLKPKHLILIVSAFLISITLWFQRSIFFEKYDAEYMHNLYSFSQWSIPLSSRIMGDDALYTYSGYNLTYNYKPFSINPETPIFAKLFFGLSARFLNNQHYASLLFLVFLLLGLDLLVKNHLKFSIEKRILLAILVFTSAEIQTQLISTVIDLPQIMLYVWHLLFLFSINKNNKNNSFIIMISGLLLGFLSATKAPLYTPIIFLIDLFYLYKFNKQKIIKYSATLFIYTIFGYILVYLPVIMSDGIMFFASAQKWILNFYLNSEIDAPVGMVIITTLTGLYKGWSGLGWKIIPSWDISWPIGLVTLIIYNYKWLRKKQTISNKLKTILLTNSVIFLLLIKLPFWPRYLVFLIPFFFILILNTINSKKILLLLLIVPIISTSKLIYNSYQLPTQYKSFFELANYEELYNYFSKDYQVEISRNEFVNKGLSEFKNVNPQNIDFIISEETKLDNQIKQKLLITLNGILGKKELNKIIYWKREHGRWRIFKIETMQETLDLRKDKPTYFCINPVNVKDWGIVYDSLTEYYLLTQKRKVEIQPIAMRLVPRDYCIPIGEYDQEYKNKYKDDNFTFPDGIQIINPFTLP